MKTTYFESFEKTVEELEPSAMVLRARSLIERGEPTGLVDRISCMGVPTMGLLNTPISASVAIRGYMSGRRFIHHERRGYLPMSPSLLPDEGVSTLEDGVPQWIDGMRRAPKYFSFGLDAVFPPYDPNYRQKCVSNIT